MKISIGSDIHLEFGKLTLKNKDGADVLVLAGDICCARDLYDLEFESNKSKALHDFFYQTCQEFDHVIYVMGNHEHYDYDFAFTAAHLKQCLGYISNLHILDKETFTLGDVTFVGSTLWTDMNGEDEDTLYMVAHRMNDFRLIKNSNRMSTRNVPLYLKDEHTGQYVKDEKGYYINNGYKVKEEPSRFSTQDSVEEHKKCLEFIKQSTEFDKEHKFVVVGHHCPSRLSVHPRYAHDTQMNGAYQSDLNDFILERPQIKLWIHGHTHEQFDYMIGSTRIVCNPRGYEGYEDSAEYFSIKTIEV